MGSFTSGLGATRTAGSELAGAPSSAAPAGLPASAEVAICASGGCPSRAGCPGTCGSPITSTSTVPTLPAGLVGCQFGWLATRAVTPNPGKPPAATLLGCTGAGGELARGGFPSVPGKETDSAGAGRTACVVTAAREDCIRTAGVVCPVAGCPAAGWGAPASAPKLEGIADRSQKPVRPAVGFPGGRLAAGVATGAAASSCCAGSTPPSPVSIFAGVSRRGAPSDEGVTSPPAATRVSATRPASNSGNRPSPVAAASAYNLPSAVSRDGAPGVDTRTL